MYLNVRVFLWERLLLKSGLQFLNGISYFESLCIGNGIPWLCFVWMLQALTNEHIIFSVKAKLNTLFIFYMYLYMFLFFFFETRKFGSTIWWCNEIFRWRSPSKTNREAMARASKVKSIKLHSHFVDLSSTFNLEMFLLFI